MKVTHAIVVCFAGLVALSVICTNPIGGTDTGNPRVSGVLYNKDGSRARNALVRLVPADYNPRSGMPAPVDSAITNDTGRYSFDSLPTNFYNVLGSSSGAVSFQDSVVIVASTRTAVPPDTLKDPGTLRGVVRLQPGDDCRTIFLIVMGTTVWPVQPDSLGNFLLSNMAEGEYRLRVISTLDQYQPLDMVFTIQAGKTTAQPDTVRLRYTGIPVPTGACLDYDSLRHHVTLAWEKADSALIKGYCVYRSDVDENTTFEQINRSLITDTVFVDSAMEDSTTYGYKICAVDKGDNKGKLSAGVQVRVGTRLLPKIVDHPQSSTFDLGSSGSLTVNAIGSKPLSYAWYKRTGDSTNRIPGQTEQSMWIDPVKTSDSGVYFCEVSNKYGSNRSGNAHVTVNFLPRIENHPQSDTVDFGKQIYLQVGATGPEPLSYTWYKKTGDSIYKIPVMMDGITWIDSAMVTDSGLYFCDVSNSYGTVRSNSAHITINCLPRIVEDLQSDTVDLGSPVWMMVVAGGPELSYVWYKKEVDSTIRLTNQNENALRIDTVRVSDTGMYFCVVSNSFGSDTSKSARIVIGNTHRIPQITAQPKDTATMTGSSVFLKVSAKGTPPLNYTWYKNGIEYESQIDDTVLWFSTATESDSGYYRCIVRNEYGADTSRQAKLSVIEIRPENSLSLSVSKVDATQVTLSWTNSTGTPYDSFRIWYATSPVPDTNPSPSVYSRQGVAGTAVTAVIRNLKELTTYYFGIQGARLGIWSNIPAAAKTVATMPKDTAQSITNTMKIIGVEYDTLTFKIRITYRVDALGFQHRVGFSWLQRSQDAPPLPTEFAEPTSSPRVGEINYIDKLGQVITFEFDPVNTSPILEYGKEYYFGGWVSKVGEKWALPTDSSIFYYAIPQPKAVPAVLFRNTDTVTAFNGQVVLRKVDPMETSVTLRLTEGLSLDSSGLIPVSIAFSLEPNAMAPVRLLVGLKYDEGLIPAGATAADVRMYRYDAESAGWFADTATIIHDTAASVMYVQKYLSDSKYPFVLAVPDHGQIPYARDTGRKP
jgi:hypothetical protein